MKKILALILALSLCLSAVWAAADEMPAENAEQTTEETAETLSDAQDASTGAENETWQAIVTLKSKTEVQLRAAAVASSDSYTGTLKNGDEVTVLNEYGEWAYVRGEGGEGYMMTRFLTRSPLASGEDYEPWEAVVTLQSNRFVPLRRQPTLQADVTTVNLNNGERVTVLSQADDWAYVSSGSATGYLLARFLTPATVEEAPQADSESAADATEQAAETAEAEKADLAGIAAPQIKLSQPDKNTVTVSWADGKAEGVSYLVYEITDGEETQLGVYTDGTEATLENVAEGTHTYKVIPAVVEGDGYTPGEASEEASINVLPLRLLAPTITELRQVGADEVVIAWEPREKAESYGVYEYVNGKRKAITKTAETRIVLTDVTEGSHSWQVVAVETVDGAEVRGRFSSRRAMTVREVWAIAPVTEAVQTAPGEVTLTWTSVEKAEKYRVYELKGEKRIMLGYAEGMEYKITELARGEHSFQVSPVKVVDGKNVQGQLSEPLTIKVVADWAVAPRIKLTQTGANTLLISWEPVGPAEYYRVFEIANNKRTQVAETKESAVTLNDVALGNHSYRVRPGVTRNGKDSMGNDSVRVTIRVVDPWAIAPVITKAEQTGEGKVAIAWTSVEKAEKYRVYEVMGETQKHEYLKTIKNEHVNLTDVTPGKHTYIVVPIAAVNEKTTLGNYSEPIEITVE